jgi:hypothetical protein
MPSQLLPQAFWFNVAISCPQVKGRPYTTSKGRLLDLPQSCRLPDFGPLEGKTAWADVRVGWNPAGFAITVEAEGARPVSFAEQPEGAYGFQVWIDTRDTRNVSRATRFCNRYSVRLHPGGARGSVGIEAVQRPIARAVADAPVCEPEKLAVSAERLKQGWLAELFIPADALHGFDPDTNRRLGFAYQVSDPSREDQFLGVGREFPVGENPSLWATLELRD